MEWQDDAILLSQRPHGDSGAIAVLFTRARGRHAGLVAGGQSARVWRGLQPGATVEAFWRGRLTDSLGSIRLEARDNAGALLLDDPLPLAALASVAALLDALLAEREPHPALFDATLALLDQLPGPVWGESLVLWELALLGSIGFGLDLSRCTVSGATEGLGFVSPRTGRAVATEAAGEWRDRLLPLPGFLMGQGSGGLEEVRLGLALTGHFLARHALAAQHRPLPAQRERLAQLVNKTLGIEGPGDL